MVMLQINLLDAKIMRATDDLEKLEIKLGQLAVLDYTAVTLPLVKSFLQVSAIGTGLGYLYPQ